MSKKQINDDFRPVIHHVPAAYQLHPKFLENLRAGAEQNTDDHCGYSEGTREAYEEFVKKRNYKIGEQ